MRSLTSLAVLATMLFATSAHAGFGVRLGAGTGFLQTDNDYEPDSISAWTVGAAYKLDLTVLELEIDALWKSTTVTGETNEATSNYFTIPVIASISLPLVPGFFSLSFGAGLEPQFFVSSDPELEKEAEDAQASMVLALPVQVGATIDLQIIAVGIDVRYEHQLTETVTEGPAQDDRLHRLMFMGGAFF